MAAQLGGAQGEAGVGRGGRHVGVGRGERRLERREGGAVAGRVMGVDGWGGEEPVRVRRVSADAQGHLVDYSAPLWVRQAVAVLNERGGRRRQDGLRGGVMGGREGPAGLVGKQRVRGQALRGRGGSVCGAAVRQVGKSVRLDSGGDVGVWPQGPVVAVPIFAAAVGHEELHLGQKTTAGITRAPQRNNSKPQRGAT